MAEDDGPLLLSHGDVLGVVVPVIAEGVELSLKFMGDGGDEGIVGVLEEVLGAEEGEGFVAEEIVDFAPDLGSDGGCVGHGVVIRRRESVYEGGRRRKLVGSYVCCVEESEKGCREEQG